VKNSNVKVSHKYTLGNLDVQTFCIQFDPKDKYIAQGCSDGTIKIYNVFTGKLSFQMNNDMEQPMPCTCIRWRPQSSNAVTKNVILTVNANGALEHWHITSGKRLHRIYEECCELLCCDYNADGSQFACAGKETCVDIYDEKTRNRVARLEGGGQGLNGHSSRVTCCKYDPNDSNIIISGGWDKSVIIWDVRQKIPLRSIYGPYICGDAIDLSNEVIMTGSYNDVENIQMWEYNTCDHFTDINWDEGLPSEKPCFIYALQFEKNNGDIVIAGGYGCNEIKVFDGDIEFKPCA
jgi:COMPASS component SWD3